MPIKSLPSLWMQGGASFLYQPLGSVTVLLQGIVQIHSTVSCSFEAILQGLEVLPCRFEVTPLGIRYLGLATLKV